MWTERSISAEVRNPHLDEGKPTGSAADVDILRLEIIFQIDTQLTLGQVTDVTLGSLYFIALTQKAFD